MASGEKKRLQALQKVFREHAGSSLSMEHIAAASDFLDDLSSRFLLNLPKEELLSFERICFAIESAHWFYEDYYCEEHEYLPSMGYRAFASILFHHCHLLQPYRHHLSDIMTGFSEYKAKIPTRGAVIVDTTLTRCLIVKGWGSKASWMFPKGKIDEGESDVQCAIREVYEEIGFNIADLVVESDLVRAVINGKEMRLFVVVGVSTDVEFVTQTRKEISEIRWVNIADLPSFGESGKTCDGIPAKRMYTIMAVSNKLRTFVRRNKKRLRKLIKTRGLVLGSSTSTSASSTAAPTPSTAAATTAAATTAAATTAAPTPLTADERNPFLNFTFTRPVLAPVAPSQRAQRV